MATTITTRMDEKIVKEIDQLSKEQQMDRATMLRNLIVEGLKKERLKRVVELYRQEKISMGKARTLLNIDFDEWLTLMKKENLYLHYDDEMLQEDLKGMS